MAFHAPLSEGQEGVGGRPGRARVQGRRGGRSGRCSGAYGLGLCLRAELALRPYVLWLCLVARPVPRCFAESPGERQSNEGSGHEASCKSAMTGETAALLHAFRQTRRAKNSDETACVVMDARGGPYEPAAT